MTSFRMAKTKINKQLTLPSAGEDVERLGMHSGTGTSENNSSFLQC